MNRKTLLTLGLLAVFVLSACTPTQSPAPPPEPTPTPEVESAEAQPAAPAPPAAAVEEAPTEVVVEAQPTSRGSQLEATDPATVNIASGQPQLIEFFAFW